MKFLLVIMNKIILAQHALTLGTFMLGVFITLLIVDQ